MKRMMMAGIGLVPIAAVALLPQAASAQAALSQPVIAPWSVAAERQYDNNRRDDWRNRNLDRRDDWRNRNLDRRDDWRNRNLDRRDDWRSRDLNRRDNDNRYNGDRRDDRDGSYRRDTDRRANQRRVWIPGHWEPGFLGIGRKWVDGHYAER